MNNRDWEQWHDALAHASTRIGQIMTYLARIITLMSFRLHWSATGVWVETMAENDT